MASSRLLREKLAAADAALEANAGDISSLKIKLTSEKASNTELCDDLLAKRNQIHDLEAELAGIQRSFQNDVAFKDFQIDDLECELWYSAALADNAHRELDARQASLPFFYNKTC